MVGVFWAIDSIIIASLVFLSFLSLSKGGHRSSINRLFSLFAFTVAIWIPANHISNNSSFPESLILAANYLVFPCALAALTIMMLFLTELSGAKTARKYIPRFLLPFIVLVGIMSPTPLLVAGIEQSGHVYAVLFGPLLPIYAIALLLPMAVIAYVMYKGTMTLKGIQREQIKAVGVSLGVCLPLVFAFLFVLPSTTGYFEFTEFGISPLIILTIGLYYSVVKHHLFDIRLAAIRTVAYILALVALSGIYYALAYLVSVTIFRGEVTSSLSVSPINIFLALVLAFIFQPIKHFFDKVTDSIFFRGRYNSEDFYSHLSEVLTTTTTDLRSLLHRIASEINGTLKAEQTFFYVQWNHSRYLSAGTKNHKSMPLQDARVLNDYVIEESDNVIVAELLSEKSEVRRLLTSHKIAIAVPLIQKKVVLGYLFLGDQRGSGYTNRDIKVLDTVSNELVIAIRNAMAVQEVKDTNANLEQRINAATAELRTSNARLKRLDTAKDEFLSMASHQLRTPLTSVKGYLSMMLDGDVGKITPMQRQVLEEAFSSSERMVHLIHDFLNVSRLQTGKFVLELQESDLTKLIEQEVKGLERVAKSRDMKLEFLDKAGPLPMTIDDTKIRQVVMNYIDNAIFYSHPGTTIKIELAAVGDEAILKVEDTGIGVPKHERERLFTKFYRATNARRQRPDGTGVGLFLAQKVVTAHGGEVVFEAKEGRRGSIFGFKLPIASLKHQLD